MFYKKCTSVSGRWLHRDSVKENKNEKSGFDN
jgi:hypothetical protein